MIQAIRSRPKIPRARPRPRPSPRACRKRQRQHDGHQHPARAATQTRVFSTISAKNSVTTGSAETRVENGQAVQRVVVLRPGHRVRDSIIAAVRIRLMVGSPYHRAVRVVPHRRSKVGVSETGYLAASFSSMSIPSPGASWAYM